MGYRRRVETLTLERLREQFSYDPETGWWTPLREMSPKAFYKQGEPIKNQGRSYIRLTIDGREHGAHRLAWFWMTGEWPAQIDHTDRNGCNNAWSNLRIATSRGNGANRGLSKNNKSGVKGVSWSQQSGKWYASIKVDQRSKNLGLFDSKDDAAAAYRRAAERYFGEFARAS